MVSPELRRHWATIARLGVIVAITVEVYYAQGEAVLAACATRKRLASASWCAGSAIKRPCEPVPVTHAPEGHRPYAEASSSPFRRAASSAAKASTPCGDQLIPWCLQRADTAQSLYFSTRVLAIHNPARCRCW